ncbi:MAG: hypothetical protein WC712_03675, partial [Candidatus Brocadiia bacterium]
MKRWLLILAVVLAFAASSVSISPSYAEQLLLLDSHANKPLDANKGIFTGLGFTTVSRADVFSDVSKLTNINAYRVSVLYQFRDGWGWSGYQGQKVPDWCATILKNYVNNGGILIGTGTGEISGDTRWNPEQNDQNWLDVFHLIVGTPSDLWISFSPWPVRVTTGQENHPIVNGRYAAYSGTTSTTGSSDMEGAWPKVSDGTIDVFQVQGGTYGGNGTWFSMVTVYRRTDNKGTAIWWNGNASAFYPGLTAWTNDMMTGAFQNMMYWCLGLAGYDLFVFTDAEAPLIGAPQPPVGQNPLPRQTSVTCAVVSPWAYAGITDTRYRCTGWSGDGTVVPASGTGSTVSFPLSGDASITWHWTKEYLIAITSAQSIGSPATEFSQWQQVGSTANLTTSRFVATGDPDVGWRLSGWFGTGSVPESGVWGYTDTPVITFICTGTGSIEWQWTQQFRLQVLNPRQIGVPSPPPGDNFFDSNDNVLATVQNSVYQTSGVRYVSSGFLGTGAVPVGGQTNSVTFVLYTPSTITWQWQNEYRLDITNPTGLGSPNPAEGYYWYPQDTVVVARITSPVASGGKNYLAVGYYLNGNAIFFDNTTNPSITLTMSGPNSIKWIVQPSDITLEIISSQGSPIPAAGTYTKLYNDTIALSVESPIPGAEDGVRYMCTGFSATGEGLPRNYSGVPGNDGSVDFSYTFRIRTNPTTVTWNWTTQYLLTIQSSLASVPSYPALGSHWMDAGIDVNASVPPFIPGWKSDGYSVILGDIPESSRNFVTFAMDAPVTIMWNWSHRDLPAIFPITGNIQTITPVDPDWGRYCSLAVDPLTNEPFIAYYRTYPDGGGSLYCTHFDGIEWVTELVDGRGVASAKTEYAAGLPDMGTYASLALDSNGRPHIAYFDAVDKVLRYAHRTVEGSWLLQTVDDGGATNAQVGEYCSLVLNKFNEPNIAYYNRTNGNLMLAKLSEAGWTIESPAFQGNIGSYARIALDPISQRPRIAYRDNDRNALVFAYFDGADWV